MGGGGGVMGWVIRDPRIIRWGGRGGFLDPRGSVIRGPPTTQGSPSKCGAPIYGSNNYLYLLPTALGKRFKDDQVGWNG